MIIWLASYPRSGNTFLRILMKSVFGINTYSIYNDEHDISSESNTKNIVGHEILPDNFSFEKAEKSKEIYFIKTHDLPCGIEKKTIYLLRDGRESSTSFFYYLKNYSNKNIIFNDVIEGNLFRGNWGEHVREWKPNQDKNIFLIKFEDLIEKPESYIDKLSNFIGIKKLQNINIPTFKELKKINPKFFRSGKKKSWKSKFTEQEHIKFWVLNYDEMLTYGYNNNIPKVFQNSEQLDFFKIIRETYESRKNNKTSRYYQFATNYNHLIQSINILFSYKREYILYGGGNVSYLIYKMFPLQVRAIVDSRPENAIMNSLIEVLGVDTLSSLPDLSIIITALGREEEIKSFLIKSDINYKRIITLTNLIQ